MENFLNISYKGEKNIGRKRKNKPKKIQSKNSWQKGDAVELKLRWEPCYGEMFIPLCKLPGHLCQLPHHLTSMAFQKSSKTMKP